MGIIETIKQKSNEVKSGVENFFTELKDNQSVDSYSMAEIGRPFKFDQSVDPNERTYKFLSTRMGILDLYPCNYGQVYTYNLDQKKSLFKYGIAYDHAMNKYKKMCSNYLGIINPPSALRIFLTDDTVVTDGITTSYKNNFFQEKVDKMSNLAQNFIDLGRSINSINYNQAVDKAISNVDSNAIGQSVNNSLNAIGLDINAVESIGGIVDKLKSAASIILKGNKLSLPKIWNTSDYEPTFSISTKLFSPYGSPKAVQEFIIKPLTMLLLMAIPHTDDMISYGKPFAVTVRSWGTSYLTVGGITNITLQRGGQDSTFNIYKQPLIINVNMEFKSLVSGICAFGTDRKDTTIPIYEKQSFADVGAPISLNSNDQTIDGSRLPTLMPTLGGIIRSMQPVVFEDLSSSYSQTKGTRETTMIGGTPAGFGDIFDGINSISSSIGFNSSGFTSGFIQASSSALSQSSFGGFFESVVDISKNVANTINNTASSIGTIIGTSTNLLNRVSNGAFGQTQLGKNINKFNRNLIATSTVIRGTVNAAQNVYNSVNNVVGTFGSLLNTDVGEKG